MSNKQGYSREGLFGTVYHYDAKGHRLGESRPGFFGGYTNYDVKGHKVGESRPKVFGGYTNYDAHGQKTGSVSPGILGSQIHYDAKGHKIGTSDPSFWGYQTHTGSFGGDANLVNNAASAAGIRRDERTIRTVIGISAAASTMNSQAASDEWLDDEDEALADVPNSTAPSSSNTVKEKKTTDNPTIRYIIAKSSRGKKRYYLTDETFTVGDQAEDSETGESIEVLATVECLKDALPLEVSTSGSVVKK